MGAAVYVTLERPIEALDHIRLIEGKSIANNWDALNALAQERGLTPLDAFLSTSHDALADLIGEDAVKASGVEVPAEQWFAPDAGLAAMRRLVEAISAAPQVLENAQGVINDLRDYAQVLNAASAKGTRFHLAFDF